MDGTFWVFGYGSLMWNPGFPHLRTERALMRGVHRALCIHSTMYRGTPERPGLVFGLDAGGSCVGMAFEVGEAHRDEVLAYLRERELITNVYREEVRPVRLASDGSVVPALAYIARPDHVQYAGKLTPDVVYERVSTCSGGAGSNADYILSTADHLAALGFRDRPLERLAARLRSRTVP